MTQSILNTRRSYRQLTADVPVDNQTIEAALKMAADTAPVAYGEQTARIIVLMDQAGQKFWQAVAKENKVQYQELYESLANAKGTVLYFEDRDHTYSLTERFDIDEAVAERYSGENHFSQVLSAWIALTELDIQASIHHPSQIVLDDAWGVPRHWTFKGALAFGKGHDQPKEKESLYDTKGFYVHGDA